MTQRGNLCVYTLALRPSRDIPLTYHVSSTGVDHECDNKVVLLNALVLWAIVSYGYNTINLVLNSRRDKLPTVEFRK